ncbi:uncharacterized protein VNE69_07059 [Vairimorpha necatrix]|uniref:Uncharacterized protein n=1 Tax=Vairimorpha necatrix TaxID=6039 RepID=A0AAX4JDD4_9MICR
MVIGNLFISLIFSRGYFSLKELENIYKYNLNKLHNLETKSYNTNYKENALNSFVSQYKIHKVNMQQKKIAEIHDMIEDMKIKKIQRIVIDNDGSFLFDIGQNIIKCRKWSKIMKKYAIGKKLKDIYYSEYEDISEILVY